MDEIEAIQKEIISYLSACLDFSIKEANRSGGDIPKDDANLKIIHDIINILNRFNKMDMDENTQ